MMSQEWITVLEWSDIKQNFFEDSKKLSLLSQDPWNESLATMTLFEVAQNASAYSHFVSTSMLHRLYMPRYYGHLTGPHC